MGVLSTLLLGLGVGGIYVLLGQSIVVVFRGARVLNFAAGAMGMVGAYTFYDLWQHFGVPMLVAMLVALAIAVVLGVGSYLLVLRRLARASGLARIVATLAIMTTLIGFCGQLFERNGAAQSVNSLLPTGFLVPVRGLRVPESQVIIAGIAVVFTIVLVLIQRRTRFGLATAAAAESQDVLASMGISPSLVAAATWAIGSVVATVAIVLVAGFSGLSVATEPLLVVPALAAALLGGFDSFELTLFGGLLMGLVESELVANVNTPGWADAGPLVLIVAVLVARGRSLPGKSHRAERFGSVGPGTIRARGAVGVVAAVALFLLINPSWLISLTSTVLIAFIVLSVIVVTGFGGQLSLAQLTLAGVAAVIEVVFVTEIHVGMVPAMLIAIVLTIPVGLLVAIPVVRTRGYELAIATLAMAQIANDLLFTNPQVIGTLQLNSLGNFRLFGFDVTALTNPRGFAVVTVVVFALAVCLSANLRRGVSGRRLLAVRANERAAAALGIPVIRIKLLGVCFAAGIAALGGVLIETQFSYPDFSAFGVGSSINSVLYAVIGGIGWPSGAVIGAGGAPGAWTTQLLGNWFSPSNWLAMASGLAVMLVILQSPDGIVALNLQHRRALLRRLGIRPKQKGDRREALASGAAEGAGWEGRAASRSRSLAAHGISVSFGAVQAVKDFSVEIESGEVVGLIGPNGAGKSTVVEALSGFERVKHGSVHLDGRDISGLGPERRAQAGVARTFQSIELFEDATILDNIRAAAAPTSRWSYVTDLVYPRDIPLSRGAIEAIEEFELWGALDKKPGEVDYWTRRAAGVARALATVPAFLILDEPVAGADSQSRTEMARLLRRVATAWNVGMLVIEHDVDFVFDLCDRVLAMQGGLLIAEGTPGEVKANEQVIAAYLGVTDDAAAASGLQPQTDRSVVKNA